MKNNTTFNSKHQYKEYTPKLATETAHRLKKCRKNKKISRAELDVKCQCDEFPTQLSTIINYEQEVYPSTKRQNVRGMRLATFYELCEFYDVSADYLLGFKDSCHRESSADYVKQEWGFSDSVLEEFKKMKNRTLLLDNRYKQYNQKDFLSFILLHFFNNFEQVVTQYLNAQADLEKAKDKYIDPKTGLLKLLDEDRALRTAKRSNGKAEIKENLYIGSGAANNSMEAEMEDLTYAVEQAKFKIFKVIEQFLKNFEAELLNNE